MASGDVSFQNPSAKNADVKVAAGRCTANGFSVDSVDLYMAAGRTEMNFDALKTGKFELAAGEVIVGVPEGGATATLNRIVGNFRSDSDYVVSGDKYIFGEGKSDLAFKMAAGIVTVNCKRQ